MDQAADRTKKSRKTLLPDKSIAYQVEGTYKSNFPSQLRNPDGRPSMRLGKDLLVGDVERSLYKLRRHESSVDQVEPEQHWSASHGILSFGGVIRFLADSRGGKQRRKLT